MSLFARARAGLALSPAERAFLKLVQSAVIAALVSLLPAVASALASGSVDWQAVAATAIATFSTAIAHAILKFFTAQADGNPAPPTNITGGVATLAASAPAPAADSPGPAPATAAAVPTAGG